MTRMEPFRVFKYYLALKLHFTTDGYDIVKNKGRVKATEESFKRRRDIYAITKISKSYNDEEVVNFLVSNFVSGDRWGGVFDSEAKNRYLGWKNKIEALSYNFKNDMGEIIDGLGLIEFDEERIFKVSPNEHPYIIKAYLSKKISIETLVILNKLFKFTDKFDTEIEEQVVWPDISRLIKKYHPFLRINKDTYNALLRRI
jgi:hypothetical protein